MVPAVGVAIAQPNANRLPPNRRINPITGTTTPRPMGARKRGYRMKTVYMCFSTDILHSGHIAIIRRAAALGELTVGVLTDEAIASYKRYPLIPLNERIQLFESLSGVKRVVVQHTLSYREALAEPGSPCDAQD